MTIGSYTEPERVHDVCLRRGMTFVTISDHNTLEGALRIAHLTRTFLSVEVTTRFPGDSMPLHVLVWGLTENDHRDLQPWRPSVYELVAFLQERGLADALAHPLYRMGPPLTAAHVERMMLLFGLWEGRNGARPEGSNDLACRLAAAVTPAYLEKLAKRHRVEPRHAGHIGLTGGSDDHGGLDIATTWTEAAGSTVDAFLGAVAGAAGEPRGGHGSTAKLAQAVGALALNAYRRAGGVLSAPIREQVAIRRRRRQRSGAPRRAQRRHGDDRPRPRRTRALRRARDRVASDPSNADRTRRNWHRSRSRPRHGEPSRRSDEPAPSPGGQLWCLTCPPDLVASWRKADGKWIFEVTNLGGQAQWPTSSVRYGWSWAIFDGTGTELVSVPPLGPGAKHTVYVVEAYSLGYKPIYRWPVASCADLFNNIPEQDETNNCA